MFWLKNNPLPYNFNLDILLIVQSIQLGRLPILNSQNSDESWKSSSKRETIFSLAFTQLSLIFTFPINSLVVSAWRVVGREW